METSVQPSVRWSSQLNRASLMHFKHKWSLVAPVFVKYFKHYTENEFSLNQNWGHNLEIERKMHFEKRNLSGTLSSTRTHKNLTNMITREENSWLLFLLYVTELLHMLLLVVQNKYRLLIIFKLYWIICRTYCCVKLLFNFFHDKHFKKW